MILSQRQSLWYSNAAISGSGINILLNISSCQFDIRRYMLLVVFQKSLPAIYSVSISSAVTMV